MSEPKFVRAEILLNEILFVGEPREKTDKITTNLERFQAGKGNSIYSSEQKELILIWGEDGSV